MHELRLVHTDLKPENILLVACESSSRSSSSGSGSGYVWCSSVEKRKGNGVTALAQTFQTP